MGVTIRLRIQHYCRVDFRQIGSKVGNLTAPASISGDRAENRCANRIAQTKHPAHSVVSSGNETWASQSAAASRHIDFTCHDPAFLLARDGSEARLTVVHSGRVSCYETQSAMADENPPRARRGSSTSD
jgi:hypothetical protein